MIIQTAKAAFSKVFEDPGTYASTMLVACMDITGTAEFMNWDPESLKADIKDSIGHSISQRNSDKLQSLLLAITTDQFYRSLESFIAICNGLTGAGVDFRSFDPATVEEMAWAATEVRLNESKQPSDFNDEIKVYVGIEAAREGFGELPQPIKFGHFDDHYAKASEAANDPDMFAAYFTGSKADVAAIIDGITARKIELFTQIAKLPLQNVDAQSFQQFANKELGQLRQQKPSATSESIQAAQL